MIFFAGWQGNYTVWSMKEIPNYNGSIGDSISSIPTLGISNALSITYNDDTSVSINNVHTSVVGRFSNFYLIVQ